MGIDVEQARPAMLIPRCKELDFKFNRHYWKSNSQETI